MRVEVFSSLVPASLMLVWLTLVPGAAQATDNNPPLGANEQAFLARALSDNAVQIAMARLALEKSTNPHVIDLANTIIQERTVLNAQFSQLVTSTGQPVTPSDNTATDALNTLNGDAFDKSFASTVARNHCRIISTYQAMKLIASNVALKNITRDAIPALQDNLTVALAVLRSAEWAPSRSQQVLAVADTRSTKTPVFWESISLVAAPW